MYLTAQIFHHTNPMQIIAIANQKGGVGKTTTSISLATGIALMGQRVLLVDLDPQANATSGLGVEPSGEGSIYHPLIGNDPVTDKIVSTRIPRLSLIPADMDLAGVEIELARRDDHEGLAKIVHVINEIKESGAAPELSLTGIIMTMFDSRTNLSKQVVEEVEKYFPDQIYERVIPRTIKIGEAPSFGKTIFEHDPSGPGSRAYKAVSQEFLERHGVSY